jgi:hypothetical protein
MAGKKIVPPPKPAIPVAEVITPEAQASMENQEKNRKLDADVEKGATKGDTTRRNMGKPFASGGSIRGGGIESSGKTKGKFV